MTTNIFFNKEGLFDNSYLPERRTKRQLYKNEIKTSTPIEKNSPSSYHFIVHLISYTNKIASHFCTISVSDLFQSIFQSYSSKSTVVYYGNCALIE